MIYRIYAGEHGLSQKGELDVLPTPKATPGEVRGRSPGYRRAARSVGFHSQSAGFSLISTASLARRSYSTYPAKSSMSLAMAPP